MTSLFFKLPRELRDTIYDYAFTGEAFNSIENGLLVYYSYKWGEEKACMSKEMASGPVWITSCKQMHSEALDQFYRAAFCDDFHLVEYSGPNVTFSPFTITRTIYFSLSTHFKVSTSRHHQHDNGPGEKVYVSIYSQDGQEKETCRRLVEVLKRRKNDDVICLEIEMYFVDNYVGNIYELENVKEWELRFLFLEAFGTCLQRVQFSVTSDREWPSKFDASGCHIILTLLQREFERIGKALVSGVDKNGIKGGWVLTEQRGETMSLWVERSESGNCIGTIEYRGLRGFYSPDIDDGKLIWAAPELSHTGGLVYYEEEFVLDALPIPDNVVRA